MNRNYLTIVLIFSAIFVLTSATGFSKNKNPKNGKKTNFVIGDNKMPVHAKELKLPQIYLRGIYLNSANGSKMSFLQKIVPKAKEAGVNCFVIDVSPYNSMNPKINPEAVKFLLDNGIFAIARVVSFQDGLSTNKIPQTRIEKIYTLVDQSVKAGFQEIQLDYIRYADDYTGVSLKQKYALISSLLKTVKERINNSNIPLSTDVFGRIVYNRDDVIGQQLESMSEHADVICPMVYPSHYFPDRFKLRNPYFTVRQSTIKGLNRIGKNRFIMPYIQAFKMNLRYTKLSLEKYMEVQVQAVEDTAARGWIFWNAMNQYDQVFNMLKNFYANNPNNLKTNNPSGYNPQTGEISEAAAKRWENMTN